MTGSGPNLPGAMTADFVTMFHDEARLAIRLNHPNVVQTLEVVQDAEQITIAMEYLHGQPLGAVLNHHLTGSHQLNLALRLRIFVDILAGLHYAHELCDYGGDPLGVVHRDVNPHNVFVTYDGQVNSRAGASSPLRPRRRRRPADRRARRSVQNAPNESTAWSRIAACGWAGYARLPARKCIVPVTVGLRDR